MPINQAPIVDSLKNPFRSMYPRSEIASTLAPKYLNRDCVKAALKANIYTVNP